MKIRFCRNSSAVGFSPSTISVTAFTKIAGVENISATYATAAPWRGQQEKQKTCVRSTITIHHNEVNKGAAEQ
jgi:hypothetical protein